jgi:hypothetical protein
MVADIARITYDPTRQYRSVISQQGRVTLEADNNEVATLAGEALRLETIDIIGPTGALGDGYKVGPGTSPSGISIDPGIFYLGGWRLELDKKIDLPSQAGGDGFGDRGKSLLVSLLLTEQSVCAVEDQALREVALGGPDSAARSRLMQHFLRLPLDGDTCAAGATLMQGLLALDGISIDPATLQLISQARLQAGFVPGPATTDPCTPVAAGGYLGADNQLVRVTITAYDATAETGTLLWSWNNASLLYRATTINPLTLTLTNTPVDEEHAPQLGQMVEILRTELDLGDGNFIAAQQGFVSSVAQAYSFDSQQIVLSAALPTEYQNNKSPLFVRLWQASAPFTAGQPTALDSVSGITVTITLPVLPSHIVARPFWRFAVRPSTPQKIYPQRYSDNPQPPDGPRQWITDLAVVQTLAQGGSKLLADCRVPFPPATQSGQCCGMVLGPDDVAARGGLQAVVNQLAGAPAVLSLRTGTYSLPAPLNLGVKHNGLTIEGCTDGVILQAAAADLTPFRLGLIVFSEATGITLRKLQLLGPAVPADPLRGGLTTLVCIGVQSCRLLTIEQCSFNLTAPGAAFGGGIVVLGLSRQVIVRQNHFSADARAGVFGVLALVSSGTILSEFDQWEIIDNQFANLDCGVLAFAQLGPVRCCRNVVTGCGSGFVFAEGNLGVVSSFTRTAIQESADGRNVALGQAANAALRADLLVDKVEKATPIFAAVPPPTAAPAISDVARQVLKDQLSTSGVSAYRALAGGDENTAAAPAAAAHASIDLSHFDKLDAISLGVEISEPRLTPALRIEDNEVTLTAGVTPLWAGLAATLSPNEPGSVMVSGNRVSVPDATTAACTLLFPVGAVVTGNMFVQQAPVPSGATSVPCLILLTRSPEIMVSANVVVFKELVVPQRSIQPASGWDFFNTVA